MRRVGSSITWWIWPASMCVWQNMGARTHSTWGAFRVCFRLSVRKMDNRWDLVNAPCELMRFPSLDLPSLNHLTPLAIPRTIGPSAPHDDDSLTFLTATPFWNPFLNFRGTVLRYRIRPVPVVFRRWAFSDQLSGSWCSVSK